MHKLMNEENVKTKRSTIEKSIDSTSNKKLKKSLEATICRAMLVTITVIY